MLHTYICIHVYISVYMYIYICIYRCIYIYLFIHVYIYLYIVLYIYIYTYIYIYIIYTYMYIYLHIHIYICRYICIRMHIYLLLYWYKYICRDIGCLEYIGHLTHLHDSFVDVGRRLLYFIQGVWHDSLSWLVRDKCNIECVTWLIHMIHGWVMSCRTTWPIDITHRHGLLRACQWGNREAGGYFIWYRVCEMTH